MKSGHKYEMPEWVKLLLLAIVVLLATLLSRCGVFSEINAGTIPAGQVVAEDDYEGTTMKELFDIALKPVGKTMYIWGGGWDSKNEKAGKSATRIGLSSKWEKFANKQDADYNFKEYRYQSEKGLDCSGYVGWVIYNLFEEKSGKEGYVTFSTEMAKDFANRGWGVLIKNPHEFKPGDIVSMDGHVWISLGTCEDGSVLLVHSSPPGVSVCGTKIPGSSDEREEEKESVAIVLAKEFMTEYFPEWQRKYPNRAVSVGYLEEVTVLRWNEDTLTDALEYQMMNGEEVIKSFKK